MAWKWNTDVMKYRYNLFWTSSLINLSDPANDIDTNVYGYLCVVKNNQTIKVPLIPIGHYNASSLRVCYNGIVCAPAICGARITIKFTTSVTSSGFYGYTRTFRLQINSIYTTVKLPVNFYVKFRVGYTYYSYSAPYSNPIKKTVWGDFYSDYMSANTFSETFSKVYSTYNRNYTNVADISNFVWEIRLYTDTWGNRSYTNNSFAYGTGDDRGSYTRYIYL